MPDETHKIGKYEIVSELGRGAMGIVYKGLDPVINRFVAIKTLARHAIESDPTHLAERFKHEAQAAGRLNHPNIVSVYEYGEENDLAFIAMEFVDGCTLAELAKRGNILDIQNIWDLILKMLDALDYAHSKGVVHRDIKPSNIICTTTGDVKIADFGIARIESSGLTQVGTVLGTPGYMSPEQLLGQRVDHRSDLFSAGILLFELLTGERAFDSTNITSTVYKVVHTELPPASKLCPTVPEAVDAVLAKALAKNPDDRFQTAKEFARAIEIIAGNHGQAIAEGLALTPCGDETVIAGVMRQTAPKSIDPSHPTQAGDRLNRMGSGAPVTSMRSVDTASPRSKDTVVHVGNRSGIPLKKKKWLLVLLGVVGIGIGATTVVILGPDLYPSRHAEKSTSQAPSLPANTKRLQTEPYTEQTQQTARVPYRPGATFTDCETCPRMVVVSPGSFTQGSPWTEKDRQPNEGPQHTVEIPYSLAVGQFEVTRGEFADFVSKTGYNSDGCWTYDGNWSLRQDHSWKSPGFPQEDSHPVTCVSWSDAKAYVKWLTGKTGSNYRLLSSSEWEYVARAGTATEHNWGDEDALACQSGNLADRSAERRYQGWDVMNCSDGYIYTAPAGTFLPNGFGAYDMFGNVFEWVEDCWNNNYEGAPTDGSAWVSGDCTRHVLRGGSWFSMPKFVRSAFRNRFEANYRSSTFGFRVARTLDSATVNN